MRCVTVCKKCRGKDLEYLCDERWFCNKCKSEQDTDEVFIETPYERTRRAVYATGNKWAITCERMTTVTDDVGFNTSLVIKTREYYEEKEQ